MMSDFELNIWQSVKSCYEFFTSWIVEWKFMAFQVLILKLYNLWFRTQKVLQCVRFVPVFPCFPMLLSNPVLLHTLFSTFCWIRPCAITTWNVSVYWKLAFVVQTKIPVVIFTGTLTFDYAVVNPICLSVGTWYFLNITASGKKNEKNQELFLFEENLCRYWNN